MHTYTHKDSSSLSLIILQQCKFYRLILCMVFQANIAKFCPYTNKPNSCLIHRCERVENKLAISS